MEWKIGEIRQINGEWYQCIKGLGCNECDLSKITCYHRFESGSCSPNMRKDGTQVIFKKLEKVGEPYVGNNGTFQSYKLAMPIYGDIPDQIIGFTTTEVVIKQNEEDMSNTETLWYGPDKKEAKNLKLSNFRPFNLELAKQGKPVCTRDGRKARIICFDLNNDEYPIVVAITNNGEENEIHKYSIDGKICTICTIKEDDLMMLPEKKEGWIIVSKNATIYDSLDDAKKSFDSDKELCICKVEWEE